MPAHTPSRNRQCRAQQSIILNVKIILITNAPVKSGLDWQSDSNGPTGGSAFARLGKRISQAEGPTQEGAAC
jgi:hypothetical protein